jgi:phosphoglucosamine mutase
VKSKPNLDDVLPIKEVIQKVEHELGDRGRVLVRYSGTEPFCRVMVEGPDQEAIEKLGRAISQAVMQALG